MLTQAEPKHSETRKTSQEASGEPQPGRRTDRTETSGSKKCLGNMVTQLCAIYDCLL